MQTTSDDLIIQKKEIQWQSTRNLLFYPEGKCVADFSHDFPFLMNFCNADANYRIESNYHDYLEIFFIYEGSGLFQANDKIYDFADGDLFIIGSSEQHHCMESYDNHTKSIEIYFPPELIYHPDSHEDAFCYVAPFYHHDDKFLNKIPSESLDSAEIFQLIKAIYLELQDKRAYYKLAVKNRLRDLLLIIARYYERFSNVENQDEKKVYNLMRLRSATEYIKNHYQEYLTLKTLADVSFMSPEHFCRFFHKTTGRTLTNYLQHFRIAKAKLRRQNPQLDKLLRFWSS